MELSEIVKMTAPKVNHCFQPLLEAKKRQEALMDGLEFDVLWELIYRRRLLQHAGTSRDAHACLLTDFGALAHLPFSLRHVAALLHPVGRDGNDNTGNHSCSLAVSETRCMACTAQTNGTQTPMMA